VTVKSISNLADTKPLQFRVGGMTCTGCAASLQKVLEQRDNVTTAVVTFSSGLATVDGTNLDPQDLARAIQGRGFSAELLTADHAHQHLSDSEQLQAEREAAWKRRAVVGLGLWLPLEILHWTATALHWHGTWMPWTMFTGALVILVFAGSAFFRSAWSAARQYTTNMDTLISLGATTAFVYSAIVLFLNLNQPMYFAEAAGLLGIVSLGHWLEARASAKAGSAVRELLRLQPETAEVLLPDGRSQTIPTSDVVIGARLQIRPGGRVPVDGVVVEGQSAVDQSIVTGESMPVEKRPGDQIVAGAMNTTGQLIVQVTCDGRNSTVTRIADMVQKAQSSRAPIQRLADSVSSVFVPTVLIIAALTLAGWWMAGQFSTGVISAVTVLIISCPCALGLATPMAVMVGTGAASRRGILIRSAETLERLGSATHVVFDKTGTLTAGSPEIQQLTPQPGTTDEELLQLAASAEAPSEHPLARAIVEEARNRHVELLPIQNFAAVPGRGVSCDIAGRNIVVERDEHATARVLANGQLLGTLQLADAPRLDAADAIRCLKGQDLQVRMLSGDRISAALSVGQLVGLESTEITADATPESKAQTIRSLGDHVVMVGDGINDAVALAASGLGVAMASGTNVAMEAASVVIPGDRVTAICELIDLSRATLRTIRQNLFFAFFYNALAIPLAAFAFLGSSGPLWAALAMGFSDVTVVGNALWLKRRLEHGHTHRHVR